MADLRSLLRGTIKLCIAAFCIWHMAAVGVYSLQNVDSQPVLKWLEQKQYIFRPYILITSQWQRWNLFSPDPLRRVIEERVEIQENGNWVAVRLLDYDHLSFFRRASELKVIRRMDEEENLRPLRDRYLYDICRSDQLPPGTPIRLSKRTQVIPKHDVPQSIGFWKEWQPEWYDAIDAETYCPEPEL